jgi:hypothetical protein
MAECQATARRDTTADVESIVSEETDGEAFAPGFAALLMNIDIFHIKSH